MKLHVHDVAHNGCFCLCEGVKRPLTKCNLHARLTANMDIIVVSIFKFHGHQGALDLPLKIRANHSFSIDHICPSIRALAAPTLQQIHCRSKSLPFHPFHPYLPCHQRQQLVLPISALLQ